MRSSAAACTCISASRIASWRRGSSPPRPRAAEDLRRQLVAFVQQLRALDLKKLPSVSETIDWARVLVLLHAAVLDHGVVRDTLNVLLKFEATSRQCSRRSPTCC